MVVPNNPEDSTKPRGASVPDLMTEKELVEYLRIPEISRSNNHHNVIDNLKRMHNLPCIHICRKALYPVSAIQRWVQEKSLEEQG